MADEILICSDCGAVKNINDISSSESYLCTIDGVPYYENTLSQCICGGDFVKAQECKICKTHFKKENFSDLICESCKNKYANEKTAFEIGETKAREMISVNGFIFYLLGGKKHINNILQNHIKSNFSKEVLEAYAKDYCTEEGEGEYLIDYIKEYGGI